MGNQVPCGKASTDVDVVPDQKKDNWETDHGAPAPAQAPQDNSKPDQIAAEAPLPQDNWQPGERAAQSELPEELIREILLGCSAKSLLSFRCLSKSVCSIIDSQDFIHQHHRSVQNRKDSKMIIRGLPMERRLDRLHLCDLDTGLEDNKMEKPYKNSAKPYGYCNGLVLLFVDSFRLAVWNPSTHQYRQLPRCPIKIPQGGHCSKTAMGLGYDSTTDEHKVVLIEDVKTDDNLHDLQVWIFGLRSNSWKRSTQVFPHGKDKAIYTGYFADGCLNWLCKPNGGEYTLVAFDMARETISEVSQALYPHKNPWTLTDLHVLDGRLCMSFFSWNPVEAVFYVRDKGRKWNQLFSVTPDMPLLFEIGRFREVKVLGYWKEGEKIMLDLEFKFIVLYDPKKKTFEPTAKRKLVGDKGKRLSYYPFLCHDSLVSVQPAELARRPLSGRKRKNRSLNEPEQPGETRRRMI